MSHQAKKVKHIVINASNIKKINNDQNKNSKNNQLTNNNPPTNTQLPLSHQQMETSSYRLSLVRNNTISNRFVETEIKESFCTSFFRDNPEMLDTRPPSIKLFEYYEKLGIYIDNNSVQTKSSFQKNRKVKINSDDIIKFNCDIKYSHSDNFSYISYKRDIPTSFTRKEKIQLLSQMIPLELIVHGNDSFELLRAHIMIAYFYNKVRKPQPAIRHLNEARKIQEKILNISNPKNSSKYSPSSITKSSRATRRASPTSIRSQNRTKYKQHEFDQQFSIKSDGYHLNEEAEKEIDDEISIELSNAYLMLAMDKVTSSSAKSKYIKNAIISLSKFIEESGSTSSKSQHLSDYLVLRKDLAQARLLFVQKKYEESARYYENVLSSAENSLINENESKTSKSDKKSSYDIQNKNENKGSNEAVKLDELEELADLKIEVAENTKKIIKNQFNAMKEKAKKIRSNSEFKEVHYENLIDDIDYVLDLYYEARDAYEDAGLDDNVEECEICIQKLESEKEEVYSILEQEEMQKKYQIEQEEEEEEVNENKDDKNENQLETKANINENHDQSKTIEKGNQNKLKMKENQIKIDPKNENQINPENNLDKKQKIDNKKVQIAENTVEIHFESSSSFDEKDDQSTAGQSVQIKKSKNKKSNQQQKIKQKVELSTPIQGEDEYGSDENEDENANLEKKDKISAEINEAVIENEIKKNSEFEQIIITSSNSENKKDDDGINEGVLKNKVNEISNSLVNENIKESNNNINLSKKSSESINMSKVINNNDNDDDSFDEN